MYIIEIIENREIEIEMPLYMFAKSFNKFALCYGHGKKMGTNICCCTSTNELLVNEFVTVLPVKIIRHSKILDSMLITLHIIFFVI
jgi:hypothetical protein